MICLMCFIGLIGGLLVNIYLHFKSKGNTDMLNQLGITIAEDDCYENVVEELKKIPPYSYMLK